MKKLEKLLNSLCELWWKPRGEKLIKNVVVKDWYVYHRRMSSLRGLVGIESGLWQFVCEKWLYNKKAYEFETISYYEDFNSNGKEFRLMLSAIQEDIPQFLLDNIQLWKNS